MALDPYALTTVADFQTYAQLSGCGLTSLAQIEALINAASALVERLSGRKFKARDYVQWYTGDWQDELALKQRPVGYIQRIAYGNTVAFTITYSGSAVRANFYTSETALVLTQVSAAGVTTTNTLLLATYPTMSTLVTAINLISGFSATLSNDAPSDELCPTIYGDFISNGNSIGLYYPSFTTPMRNLNRDAGIVGFPGTGWTQWGGWGYWTGGTGSGAFGSWGSGSWGSAFMPAGFQGILIKYRAGYDTIPADIVQLVNEIVAFMVYQANGNTTMQSESIGDYSYTRGDWLKAQEAFKTRILAFSDFAVGVG